MIDFLLGVALVAQIVGWIGLVAAVCVCLDRCTRP